ncbi:MAG: hypothetical protein HYW01_08985 [Deltaproteobacteria bacterium]|nr:hypothetical protein [Deltaproteobacteria bacterium]
MRLLQVKRQLSDFNSYFQIKEEKGLTLVFLKPILLGGDIVWLMKSIPTSEKKTDKGELWQYVLEKQYPGPKNEEGKFDISISMYFENDRLRQINFPERFLEYISKPMLIKMMKSMGDAEIDKSERRAGSKFQARSSLEIPRKQQVVEVLGLPFSAKDSKNTSTFIYKYNLRDRKTDTTSGEFRLAMGFNFQKEDYRLIQAETNLNGLRMSLDFSFNEK